MRKFSSCFKASPLFMRIDWLIDWIEFYTVSAISHPCYGGHDDRKKICLWNNMPQIMANSIYGQGHEDKDIDTCKKNLTQEMLMCYMKALIFLILLQIFFFMISNVKVKRFRTNMWNMKTLALTVEMLLAMLKFSNSKVNNVGSHGKVLSQGILMLNIKAIALAVQKLLARLTFSENWSNSMVKITG